ncbi:hypothetical protein GJ496_008917 [Pomphorhynchus laevis]|nr:hypothetical protein GJ496_008917 [Pomphorhynchus laevis]
MKMECAVDQSNSNIQSNSMEFHGRTANLEGISPVFPVIKDEKHVFISLESLCRCGFNSLNLWCVTNDINLHYIMLLVDPLEEKELHVITDYRSLRTSCDHGL